MYLYYLILYSHFALMLFMLFGWLSNHRKVLWTIFVLLLIGIVLFIALDGCFITKIERQLSGKNYSLIDPLLSGLGIEINKSSRNDITLYIGITVFLIVSYKLFLK